MIVDSASQGVSYEVQMGGGGVEKDVEDKT